MTPCSDDPCLHARVGELARAHTPALAAVARGEGLEGDAALDVVQDALHAFLLLPEARRLAGSDGARRFLVAMVRNGARNLRRRRFRAAPHVPAEDAALVGLHDAHDAEGALAAAETHAQLEGCVGRLGDVKRKVVTLRVLEEASAETVARELGLSEGHVAVLLHRAKKELHRCMTEGLGS